MRKSICLIFIIIAISFSACVGGDDLDVPLSATEKTFYENLKDNGFGYDSIRRGMFRYKNLIWIKERGKYNYRISVYNKSGKIDSVFLEKKVDSIALFVYDYMESEKMRLNSFTLFYDAENLSTDFFYDVDKKAGLQLTKKRIW